MPRKAKSKAVGTKNERNYGVDLLRLLSMLFVVILHTLLKSKLLVAKGESGGLHSAAWLLEVFCYGAVDIFALISGYVGYREKEKPLKVRRLLSLWIQAAFYGFVIFIVYRFIRPELATGGAFFASVMPIVHQSYWYLTAFVALFFVMPILNAGVRSMTEQQCKKAIWVALGLFSVLTIVAGDLFKMSGGYSFLWLAVLYYVGAAMKKSGFLSKLSQRWCLFGYFACSVISWAVMMFGTDFHFADKTISEGVLVNYVSPTIVLASMFLLAYFSRLQIKKRAAAVISCFAPCAFAVYLLNCNPLIWKQFLPTVLSGLKGSSVGTIGIMAYVLLFSLAFFVAAILIEKLRLLAIAFLKRGKH